MLPTFDESGPTVTDGIVPRGPAVATTTVGLVMLDTTRSW